MASDTGRQTLESWIDEALKDPDQEGPCTMLSLVHMHAGGGKTEVASVAIQTKLAGRTPHQLADLFERKAHGFAQDLSGLQMFQMMAFYNGATEPKAFHPIRIAEHVEHLGMGSEGPNAHGLVSQAQRHTEYMITATAKREVILFEASLQMMNLQQQRITALSSENLEMLTVFKEMMMEKALADHSLKLEELKYERQSKQQAAILKLAPALINKVAGSEIFPQSMEDTALIETLAENVSPEDLQFLEASGKIPKEMCGILMARFAQAQEKKNQERQRAHEMALEARSAPSSIAAAESEAAGEAVQ